MILAIETSDILCSVAFCDEGRTLIEYNLEQPMQHAALVGKLVDNGLKFLCDNERDIKYLIEDISLVVVAIGPGSFTGLRIGLSYAQGFCFARKIPITGVSNHQVLAANRTVAVEPVITLIEARRNEVYLAEHETVAGLLTNIINHRVVDKDRLTNEIEDGSAVIFMPDLDLAESMVRTLAGEKSCAITRAKFSASILAQAGLQKYKLYGGDNLDELEPMYIRPFAGVL